MAKVKSVPDFKQGRIAALHKRGFLQGVIAAKVGLSKMVNWLTIKTQTDLHSKLFIHTDCSLAIIRSYL